MLHRNQKAYLLDIAKLIILTVASKFGVSLKMHVETILYLRLSKDS